MNKNNILSAHWKRKIELLDPLQPDWPPCELQRGYLCSNCGKHSWVPRESCDGCGASMLKYEVDIR